MSAETLAAIAVALGAGWASGLNAYAAVLVLGVAMQLLFELLRTPVSPFSLGAREVLP